MESRENGIALITSLLVLLLLSTMIVGIAWLVLGDQRLGGNNKDRQLAFYGAEAGMESLTASLENLFDANYAPNATAVNNLLTNPGPPSNIPGVQYIAPGQTTAGSGYQISFTPSTSNPNLPASSNGTIPTGTYAGLVGLMTPYTLTVTARTAAGSEVRLQREVQTVGIPVFQFGFFSQTDLDFFAGPNFNFGGRVHTNGNLWLAEGSGNALTLNQKVTTAGELISSNLENGYATATAYPGAVDITNGSGGYPNLLSHSPDASVTQSVTGTSNNFTSISSFNTNFSAMASTIYNNNIAVGQPNGPVTPLNLAIATPAIGGQPIDLIRRPVQGENTTNLAKYNERYYGNTQLSLRILLSDYGSDGTCATSDISSTSSIALPGLATNGSGTTATPVDLATLAWDTSYTSGNNNASPNPPPYKNAPAGLTSTSVGITIFPLPVSYAQSAAYGGTTGDGYWVQAHYPIITGCLKIDMQNNSGTWSDVTWNILNYGFTGRNIDPQIGANGIPSYVSPGTFGVPGSHEATKPLLSSITGQVGAQGPTAGVTLVGCQDPSPSAIIRLARVRDNPSTALGGTTTSRNNYCGGNPSTGGSGTWYTGGKSDTATCTTVTTPPTAPNCYSQAGTDYWPNVLFDTREALLRDPSPAGLTNVQLPLAGAMYYVELDAGDLASWFTNDATGKTAFNTNGYGVYFSDRRGEQKDPNPPASVGTTAALTGGFGWEDNVNSTNGTSTTNGCPNSQLDQGEDMESDYNSSGVSQNPVLRTYANILYPNYPNGLWPTFTSTGWTQLGTVSTLVSSVLSSNPLCTSYPTSSTNTRWPYAIAKQSQDLRQNPPIFFRRALKIVDGSTINVSGWPSCNSVPCGLTIASENPVYLQGDYNNPGLNTSFTGTGVAAAIVADAVTLLSDNWNDVNSFAWPYLSVNDNRTAATTTYRTAVAAGKGIPFIFPTGNYQDFGTDGGAHNFLRYLEDWGGDTLYYEGSIVSMFYNHQAVGTYKCCNNVYSPPTRGYQFDTNFLTPNLLPPLTPMLRLINTIGFTQMLLPTQ